jgi:aspartyl-tRNA(Asn)/glutamyl-tRNA(Gln) amidotransferase subunit B
MTQLEVIIGLEVHAQINTATKMFCSCDNDAFEKAPNTTVCPVCMGHPGTLPVPNGEAVKKAVRMSLALGCTVNPQSHFDRKHYFYPDLPMGFQISQYDFPLASHGAVTYTLESTDKTCRIHRLHLENDAGKLTHAGTSTLCDYNRAGTPLMEIVTEPDLRSAEEAVAFAEELRRTLIAANASDADMFKGMMRFDASISLREVGTEKLNPRSEIKNLNSFKALERSLKYEEKRLRDLWEEEHGPLKGDITVGWMDDEGKTRLLRDKETATDYRYFPEPDIPPLHITDAMLSEARAALPEKPGELRKRYLDLGLSDAEALVLVDESAMRERFEAVQKKTGSAKRASGIVLTQMKGFLATAGKNASDAPSADALVELVTLIDGGTISANAGKEVLAKMVESGKSAKDIVTAEGMDQIADEGELLKLVEAAIAANPKAIETYKAGKQAALGAVVGWIMKESKGKADPTKVSALLKHNLTK